MIFYFSRIKECLGKFFSQIKSMELESTTPPPSITDVSKLKAGQIVMYRGSDGTEELVTVQALHYDDFPNVYCTVKHNTSATGDAGRERQTDGSRIRAIELPPVTEVTEVAEDANTEGDMEGFGISLSCSGRTFRVNGLNSQLCVHELKDRVQAVTGVPVQAQKLIHKGKVLNGRISLGDARITEGSKVVLVSSLVAN
jgi:hypothetical protein